MTAPIFLVQGTQLVEMRETAPDSEDLLQSLLERFPSVLPTAGGEPGGGRLPWLLVRREAGIPDGEEVPDRWSVDHLFLDRQGVPTLVEVKRAVDTRIRREVVGQMLDYAANAVAFWPPERIQAELAARCEQQGEDADAVLGDFLDGGDPAAFWATVKTNLQARRLRLLFVADAIPPELRRIVEFLNEQMDPTEVLAIEVKRYTGDGVETLVPRVIGASAKAEQKKRAADTGARQWDEPSFFAALEARAGPEALRVAREIFAWHPLHLPRAWFGRGTKDGSFVPTLDLGSVSFWPFGLWVSGLINIKLQYLADRPPFDDVELRAEIIRRLNRIDGVRLSEEAVSGRPSFAMKALAPEGRTRQFLEVMEWVVEQAQAYHERADGAGG